MQCFSSISESFSKIYVNRKSFHDNLITGIPKVRVQIPLESTILSWLRQCKIIMKRFCFFCTSLRMIPKLIFWMYYNFSGVLNLTHLDGHSADLVEDLKPGERYTVQLVLDAAGYTVLEGHTMRLALSQSYWPSLIWPPPYTPVLLLHFTSTPVLTLPIRNDGKVLKEKDEALRDLGDPVFAPPLPTKELRKPSNERLEFLIVFECVHVF